MKTPESSSLTAELAAMSLRIRSLELRNSAPAVQSGSVVQATDANGDIIFAFPHPFLVAPDLVASPGDPTAPPIFTVAASANTSTTQAVLRIFSGATGDPLPNYGPIRVNWIGIAKP